MKTLQTQWFPNQFEVQVRRPTGWGWEGPRAPVPRPRVCLGEGAFVGPGGGGPPRRGVCPELPDCGPELSHSPFRSRPASSRPSGPGVCQNLSRGHGRRPPPPLAERPWQFPWVTGLCTQWRAQGAAPAGPLLALLSVFSSLSYPTDDVEAGPAVAGKQGVAFLSGPHRPPHRGVCGGKCSGRWALREAVPVCAPGHRAVHHGGRWG